MPSKPKRYMPESKATRQQGEAEIAAQRRFRSKPFWSEGEQIDDRIKQYDKTVS